MEYKPKKYKKNMQLIKSVFIKAKEKIPKFPFQMCCLCLFYNTDAIL